LISHSISWGKITQTEGKRQGKKIEDGGRRAEDGGWRAEDGGQKTEDGR